MHVGLEVSFQDFAQSMYSKPLVEINKSLASTRGLFSDSVESFIGRSGTSAAKLVKGVASSNTTRPGVFQPLPTRPDPVRPAAAVTTRAPAAAKRQLRAAPQVSLCL